MVDYMIIICLYFSEERRFLCQQISQIAQIYL